MGLDRGSFKQLCKKTPREENGQTLKFYLLNNHSCVRNNTWSKNVSYVDTTFSTTESFLTHCTAPTGVHFDRGEGRVLPYMAYIYGGGFCPLCPKHGVSKGWTTGNNRHGVKIF